MQSYSKSDRHSSWVTPGQVASRLCSSLSVRIGVRSCRQPSADVATPLTSLCCSLSHYNLAVLPRNWESAGVCWNLSHVLKVLESAESFSVAPFFLEKLVPTVSQPASQPDPNRIPTVHSHMAWLGCDVARKCSKVDWAAKAPAAMWYHSNLSALAFH